MATPRPSLRTTRPFITSFKAQTPSNKQGQLTISSMEPEKERRSATSNNAPVLLMLQVRPDLQRSSFPINLYSTAKLRGKRWRDRRSNERSSNGNAAMVATDIHYSSKEKLNSIFIASAEESGQ